MGKEKSRRLRRIDSGDVVVMGKITAGRRVVPGDQVGGEAVSIAEEKLLDGSPLPERAIVSPAFVLGGIESPEGKFELLFNSSNAPVLTASGKFVYVPRK